MSSNIQNPVKGAILGAFLSGMILSGGITTVEAAGLLSPSTGGTPPLEIRDHSVDVVIEDGYAITRIEQVFANPHQTDFEAIYSFPVPDKAAVSEFTYWIDGKPVSGEVVEKKRAREIYEKEKSAGRETAIAEQDSYKTFDMTVYPVRAGQDVRVRLSYIQPAHVDTGIGRFLYPLEEGGVDTARESFWSISDAVTGSFSFDLDLRSAYPVQGIRLPAHPNAQITRDAEGDWHVHIGNGVAKTQSAANPSDDMPVAESTSGPVAEVQPGETKARQFRLDTDIIVYWKLQDGLPGGLDLVAHREAGSERGSFMMVLTPGDDLQPIAKGRDWVFVLDISGSMRTKYNVLAEGISQGLRRLTPHDRFRFVYFNDTATASGDFVPATPEAINNALRDLSNIQVEGGTNLYAGLSYGLNGLDSDRSAGVVLVTDGVANVGETHKRAFINLVDKQDVRLFTLVMGNSANRPLLNAISLASGGTAVSVSNSDDVIGAVLNATGKLTHEALHDVSVSIDGIRTSDIAPARIGSLYRGQQLVLFGHYWGSGQASVTLKAKISGQPVSYTTHHHFSDAETRNPEIERLWAFASIEDLMEEISLFGADEDIQQAITDLAVENGLVTPFTSMVVVREEIFAQYQIDRTNRDRLATEKVAQQQRTTQPVAQSQVAQSKRSYASPRPVIIASNSGGSGGSTGGGHAGGSGGAGTGSGSVDAIVVLLLLLGMAPLAGGYIRRKTVRS